MRPAIYQTRATILATVVMALAACGQKGPLTFPAPPAVEPSKAAAKSADRPYPDVPATSEKK